MNDNFFAKETEMAEEFDCFHCPICDGELVYSEGTHDLGCKNNPKPFENYNKKNKSFLHEDEGLYGSRDTVSVDELPTENIGSAVEKRNYKVCNNNKHESKDGYKNVCELPHNSRNSQNSSLESEQSDLCVFGLSFTESASNGTLWSIRIVDGETNYAALMRLMQKIEQRVRDNQPFVANVPNLPKKIERTKVKKLAFRYNLEIEDLYSIKYSTETIERLALFYNLTNKEIRHIKQTDVMEE